MEQNVGWCTGGFELLHRTRQLGISRRRADLVQKVDDRSSKFQFRSCGELPKGPGPSHARRGAAGASEAFLGPLHKFMSLHPQDSVRAVPPCVSFFLRYLAEQISQCRHHDSSVKLFADQVAPRVDAQGAQRGQESEDGSPKLTRHGRLMSRLQDGSHWRLPRRIFVKGSKPALIISPSRLSPLSLL